MCHTVADVHKALNICNVFENVCDDLKDIKVIGADGTNINTVDIMEFYY